jgi:hypothetical protein
LLLVLVLLVRLVGKRSAGLRRVLEAWFFGMSFDMLLQVLGTLEGLLAEVALVGLQGNMNPDVRGDMIPLDRRGATGCP